MADTRANIPDREVFKAAEVCEIASVQPYVLRSWEQEFPSIGTSRSAGAPRVYRRVDVERILRIKDLVFVEGLTLAGARRRLEEEEAESGPETPATVDPGTRETLERVKDGLRGLLTMLGEPAAPRPVAWPPARQTALLEFEGQEPAKAEAQGGPKRAAGGRKRSVRSS